MRPVTTPVASVLVAAYDAEATLAETLASARAQTEPAIEILVMDDGSRDRTRAIAEAAAAEDPRVRVFSQANAGKATALNRLIHQARGRHLAILDADDLAEPARVAVSVARLEAEPRLGGVLTGHSLLLARGGRWVSVAPRAEAKDPDRCAAEIAALQMPAHDPTLMVRREIAAGLGFDPGLRIGQGVDFVFRLAEAHPIAVIGQALYRYRVSPGTNTRRDPAARAAMLKAVFDAARTRRGEPHLTEPEFAARIGAAAASADNNLAAHFVDSAYTQATGGDRWGALRAAAWALRLYGPSGATARAAAYALSPAPLARAIRARGRAARAREARP